MDLGAILKACRVRAGLSQEDMAEKMNRSPSCVSKFENDRKPISMQEAIQWFNATNAKEVAVAYIMGIDGITIMQSIIQMFGG